MKSYDKDDDSSYKTPESVRFGLKSTNERVNQSFLADNCSLKIEWLNSKEAAEYLRISVKSLRNMASNGQIPFYKLGRRNRYRKDELESILLSQKRGE